MTQWLKRTNAAEAFITSESDDDDELENEEPPKNLQSNPMPALSVNDNALFECSNGLSKSAKNSHDIINNNLSSVNDRSLNNKENLSAGQQLKKRRMMNAKKKSNTKLLIKRNNKTNYLKIISDSLNNGFGKKQGTNKFLTFIIHANDCYFI